MPAKGKVNWLGDDIVRKAAQASRRGIDVTLANAIAPAKRLTPVVTGTAQGSIQFRLAQIRGKRVTGRWGSFDVDYFIWLEIGAHGRRAYRMLRRTADAEYPKLAGNIRQQLKRTF